MKQVFLMEAYWTWKIGKVQLLKKDSILSTLRTWARKWKKILETNGVGAKMCKNENNKEEN